MALNQYGFHNTYIILLYYSCSNDYLELFDGDSTTSPSLGKYCGSVFYPISSSQRFLTLQFISDSTSHSSFHIAYPGFRLFYNFTNDDIRKYIAPYAFKSFHSFLLKPGLFSNKKQFYQFPNGDYTFFKLHPPVSNQIPN